jgi:hypothetical protein
VANIQFAKIDANLDDNPKILDAGFWGSVVYQVLLRLNRKHQLDGVLPRRYCTPKHLVRTLNLEDTPGIIDEPTSLMLLGLNECARVELIALEEDNVWILGYDDEWAGPSSSSERMKKWREEQRKKDSKFDARRAQIERDRRRRKKPDENVVTSGDDEVVTTRGNVVTRGTARTEQNRKETITGDVQDSTSETPSNGSKTDTDSAAERGNAKPRSRKRSNSKPKVTAKQALTVTQSVIEFLNRKAKRRLQASGYIGPVKRLLQEKYTEVQMRLVVWWAIQEWGDDAKMKKRITPNTLFKMTSPQGFRTFPAYLSEAMELWEQVKGRPFDENEFSSGETSD